MAGRDQDSSRAKKTIYVTGFDPRYTTKQLLEELFMQGGPVTDVVLFDTHAYVQFQDQESVPYSLALFSEIELHGRKLRISAKHKSRESLSHLKYLMEVRDVLRERYNKMSPPKLPPKKMPPQTRQTRSYDNKKRQTRNEAGRSHSNRDRGNRSSDSKSSHRRRSRKQYSDQTRSSHQSKGRRR